MPRKPEFVAPPPVNSVCLHNGKVPADLELPTPKLDDRFGSPGEDVKIVIDALPGVQYAEGTFAPGTHETPNRIIEVPSVTGPSLEALGETRLRLRANLAHARGTVKGPDDTRAVAAENALRKFDESGDGIRLRLFAVGALKESSHAQA